MEILRSLGLIVFLLLALNHMAGGKPNTVLRPVGRLAQDLIRFFVGLAVRLFGGVLRLLAGSLKAIPPPGGTSLSDKNEGGASPKPPPRW